FFQAEDGIRDGHVTGVQTCALPISEHSSRDRIRIDASDQVVRVKTEAGRRGPSQIDYAVTVPAWMALNLSGVYTDIKVDGAQNRSEERRVGKECICRW